MTRLTPSTTGTAAGGTAAPVQETTVTSADGATLHVEVHGDAAHPPVVLAHGWTCSTRFWDPVVRELTAAGHRVVVYDQRGHGRSPRATPHAYSPASLADDLCAVLSGTLKEGEQAVIGGHSMGGMTIMAAADRREVAEHGAALMLCSTGAHDLLQESLVLPFPSQRLRRAAHRLLLGSGLPLGPVSPVTKKALKYATMGPGSAPERVAATARLVHACPPDVRAAWGAVLAELDVAAKVRLLTAPTAVVVGDRDRLTPVAHARGLAEALPQCTGLTELTGLGHMTPLEAPEAVVEVVLGLARDHLEPGARVPSPRAGEQPAAPQSVQQSVQQEETS